jgi:hypothetical protein
VCVCACACACACVYVCHNTSNQVLAETAPGVKPGGEVRRQEWCCGPTAPGESGGLVLLAIVQPTQRLDFCGVVFISDHQLECMQGRA